MSHSVKTEIQEYLLASISLIYLKTFEYEKSIRITSEAASELGYENVLVWTSSKGLRAIKGEVPIHEVLDTIQKIDQHLSDFQGKTVLIIQDIHRIFDDEQEMASLQDLIDTIKRGQTPVNLVAISVYGNIPQTIENHTYLIDIKMPSKDEIEILVKERTESFGLHLSKSMREQLSSGLNGLVEDEIISLLNRAISKSQFNGKHLDYDMLKLIALQKKQVIQKSGMLEFIDDKIGIDDVGGLYRLKRWLKDRKQIFENMKRAKEYGLKPPKGILLFGTPGSGKSLTAKVVATFYNLPLLRVDMGLVYGQASPEEAIGRVLALADGIAPCIFWIDELEKALAGSESDSQNDSAIKILGILLTWMQERTAPVFLIATANDISMIRPETYRDGRIDEKFFLGFLEDEEQIAQIIDIHLKIRLKENVSEVVRDLDYALITKKMRQKIAYYGGEDKAGYSGANMEALVEKVLQERFFRDKQFIETKDFIRMLNIVKPQHGPNISIMLHRAREMDAITA